MTTPYAFVVRLEAKPERAAAMAELLRDALPLAEAEPRTVTLVRRQAASDLDRGSLRCLDTTLSVPPRNRRSSRDAAPLERPLTVAVPTIQRSLAVVPAEQPRSPIPNR